MSAAAETTTACTPERALVTGGAGFIGSNLTLALLKTGATVTVLDDFSTGHRENLADHPHLTIIDGDVRDTDLLESAMDGADTVFHLAASVGNKRSIDDPLTDSDINVMGTLRLLLAARAAGVRKVVASSSAAVYGELCGLPIGEDHRLSPQTPYASSKLAMENHALAFAALFGMDIVCLRYFNVYGERQRFDPYGNVIPIFADRLATGASLTVFGDGEQTRDFVHVDDVVAANIAAACTPNISGAYNIASGTTVTVNALAKLMLAATGSNEPIVHAPERPGDVRHSQAAIRAANDAFNYAPQVRLEAGIVRYINWLSEVSP